MKGRLHYRRFPWHGDRAGPNGVCRRVTCYENESEAIEAQQTLSALSVLCACYPAKMEDITAAERLISRVREGFR